MAGSYSPDQVARFCSFFESKLSAVRALQEEVFQRPLLLSMLESIGKCRYSPVLTGNAELGNGQRFKKLVNEHGNWPDVEKHSLPQILYRLEEEGIVAGDLYVQVSSAVGTWRTGGPRLLSADYDTTTLMAVAALDKERAIVKWARHDSLLWLYRNSVVHEFREPGYPWPFPETPIPHYIHMTDAGRPQSGSRHETWELSYPTSWLDGLVRSALAGLASYCNAHRLNPYDAYQFGSRWPGT